MPEEELLQFAGTVSWKRSLWGFFVIRVTGGLRGDSWDSEIKVKRTVFIIAFGQDLGQVHAGLGDNKVLKSKLEVFTWSTAQVATVYWDGEGKKRNGPHRNGGKGLGKLPMADSLGMLKVSDKNNRSQGGGAGL